MGKRVPKPGHPKKLVPDPLGQEKKHKLNFKWPKMARSGPRFDHEAPPKTIDVYPFLRSFASN